MKDTPLVWALKGIVMGAADAVPGVSGGTMALITGIYERLVAALAAVRWSLVRDFRRGGIRTVWRRIDGTFLVCLGGGILLALVTVLNLVHWLLSVAPQLLWAYFFGLIVASLLFLMRRQSWHRWDALLLTAGTVIAASVALSSGVGLGVSPATLVLGGALAICAMLLPGISGSFILLLLGLYPAVVEAVHQRDLPIIAWVALGCVLGALLFSRLLNWLLHRWHDRVLGFMLGFILGALIKVWPWQYQQQWYPPSAYEQASGEPAWVMGVVVSALLGGLTVIGLTWKSRSFGVVKS